MAQNTPSRACATLADAILAVTNDAALTQRQRHDRISAIRTAARLLERDPAEVPANPRLLAVRLAEIAPAAHGISRGRWANIRSLIRQALSTILIVTPGRQLNPLSPAWQSLWDRMRAPRYRHGLSRFAHFCSAEGIDPEAVDAGTFERFLPILENSLLADPATALNDSRAAWNRACAEVDAFPGRRVEGPTRDDRYSLPWSAFPASLKGDVDAWLEQLSGRDILAELTFRPVGAGTLRRREYQVRIFASGLVHRGVAAATLTSLKELVRIDRLKEGLRFHLDRHGGKSSSGIEDLIGTLKAIAVHWVGVSDEDRASITALQRRLTVKKRGLTDKNRTRLRAFDDGGQNAQALLGLPTRLMAQADKTLTRRPRAAALLAQKAVAIELLLMAPIRIGNLAALDRDRHLVQAGRNRAALHLVIEGEIVKNHENLEFPLPPTTVALLHHYLTTYQPVLAPGGSTAIFPGRGGKPKFSTLLGKQISEAVFEYTQLRMHAHLFRHTTAKLFLEAHPGGYEVMRRVLGHRSIETTTAFYCGLETAAAVRHFDDTIIALGKRKAGR